MAQNNLGAMYENGGGVDISIKQLHYPNKQQRRDMLMHSMILASCVRKVIVTVTVRRRTSIKQQACTSKQQHREMHQHSVILDVCIPW